MRTGNRLLIALGLAAVTTALLSSPIPQFAQTQPAQTRTQTRKIAAVSIPFSQLALRKAYGSPQAPITIDVFSDYQCPHCREFYEGPAIPLMQDYVDTGKVYLVHHDFPMPQFTHSREAAHWANAAAVAGIFPEVDQALYATQDQWGATGKIDDALAKILSPADMKKLRAVQAVPHPEFDDAIARDQALGKSKGVMGTPGIFVTHNGPPVLLPGVPSYALLKGYLDSLLQR